METRKFTPIARESEARIEDKFLSKDFLTREDIVQFVEELLQQTNTADLKNKPEERAALLVDALRDETILKKVETQGVTYSTERGGFESNIWKKLANRIHNLLNRNKTVTAFELGEEEIALMKQATEQIRRAILDELSKRLEPAEFQLITEELSGPRPNKLVSARISTTRNAYGKENVHRGTDTYSENTRQTIIQACKRLVEIEQSGDTTDHIIPIHSFDEKTGAMIVEKGRIRTIRDLIHTLNGRPENAVAILRVLQENMQGAAFLEKHGLMIEDIKPENLGLYSGGSKKIDGKGLLFDLDGLIQVGIQQTSRWVTLGFVPPELPRDENGIPLHVDTVTSPKEMTYQFGKSLEQVAGLQDTSNFVHPKFKVPAAQLKEITALVKDMTEPDPNKRPFVHEAVKKLELIINTLAQERQPRIQAAA